MRGRNGVDQPPIGRGGAKPVGVEARRKIRAPSRGVMAGLEPVVVEPGCPENPLSVDSLVPVPQTDTGRRVEYTKVTGRTYAKELGNMTS
jgi:hypothetical protein